MSYDLCFLDTIFFNFTLLLPKFFFFFLLFTEVINLHGAVLCMV